MLSESTVPPTSEMPAHCSGCGTTLPAGWAGSTCPGCLVHFSIEALDVSRVFAGEDAPIVLGDYELLEEIARGGMGVVYRARQRRLGRTVAVKVLAAGEFAAPDARGRFRAEAEAVARLRHPGIVAIHDVGENEGTPWFSMDFVAGEDLGALVQDQPLPARQAADYVRAIAEAVQHAHDHGVLHRDLKPSNILLDPDIGPRVTDFGIARCAGPGKFTRTGEVLGSPGYAAPEQALAGTADARTDVYGLGALLYHLLTARPPFQGPTLDAILLQLHDAEPLAPRRLNPAVPRNLETICLRCLRKEPAHRYSTAREVADDLARFLRGEPIYARPASIVERTFRWCRRRPAVATLLVALAAVATLAFWYIDAAKNRAESASVKFREANARLEDSLNRIELERAEDLFRAGDSASALAPLARVVRRNPSHPVAAARLASALWHGNFALPLTPPFSAGSDVLRLQFLRDGRTLLVCTAKGIALWDASAGRRLIEFEHDGTKLSAAILSPDERTLVAWQMAAGANLYILNVETGRRRVAPIRHEAFVPDVQFSPDSAHFFIASSDPIARMYDAQTGQPLGEPMMHRAGLWCAAISPDGATLVTAAADRIVRWWDGATHAPLRELPPFDSEVRLLRFSPDGAWLVAALLDGTVEFLSAADGRRTGQRMRHEDRISTAVFSADGQRLLTASLDHTARVWSVPGGEPLSPPLRHRDTIRFAAFNTDGTRIATCSSDHTSRVWDVRSGRPLTQPLRHLEQPRAAAFTPDGADLYTSGADSIIQRWDLRLTNKPGFSMSTAPARDPVGVRISADGRYKLTFDEGAKKALLTDARNGSAIGAPLSHFDSITAVNFSPDSALAATASNDNTCRVWETATGRAVSPPLRHGRTVSAVAFHPDSRRIATASWDGTARVWDAHTGVQLCGALKHDDDVTDVQFSPDGRRVATASRDKIVRVWDTASGQPIIEPLRHDVPVMQVRFQPDGQRLFAQTANAVCAWDVPDFPTPPPGWLAKLADTLSLAELPTDPADALSLVAAYERTRAEALSTPGDGPYARLAQRLFSNNVAKP